MKHFFTLLLTILFASSTLLQSQPIMENEQKEGIVNKIGNYWTSFSYAGYQKDWTVQTKRLFLYDSNMRRKEFKQQIQESENWVDAQKYDYEYNNEGLLSDVYTMRWYWNKWDPINHTHYEYYPDGLRKEVVNEQWELNSWKNIQKYQYEYNDSGLISVYIVQVYDSTGWLNLQKINFKYDKFNNIIEQLVEKWDGESWVNNSCNNYNYSDDGKYLSSISKIWSNSQWYNNSKDSAIYDNFGKNIGRLTFRQLNQEWIFDYKYSYTLGSNDNIIKLLIEKFNSGDNTWSNYIHYSYNYDEHNNEIEALNEFWQFDHWENNIKTNSQYNNENILTQYAKMRWQNDGWINDIKFDYDYSQPTSISYENETLESDDFCYPNPSRNMTSYNFVLEHPSLVKATILDINGKNVKNGFNGFCENGSQILSIRTDDLPSGVYFLRIESDGSIKSIPFVVGFTF